MYVSEINKFVNAIENDNVKRILYVKIFDKNALFVRMFVEKLVRYHFLFDNFLVKKI